MTINGRRERERERGVTLVRVTLTWNLFVVAYQVCNLTKNIFPPSKSNFFFIFFSFYLFLFFIFYFYGDKRKCFLWSTFCAVSNTMKHGEKTEHKYILIYLSHCVFFFVFVFPYNREGGWTHIFFSHERTGQYWHFYFIHQFSLTWCKL